MPARAMWKAELGIGNVTVPVKLYAAVQDAQIHFRLLHAKDLLPVEQQMVDPVEDQRVAKEQIQRGIQVAEGTFVVLTDKDREQVEPKPSRRIEVEQLVDPTLLDFRWFERPYYLGPDGDDEGYFALAQALEDQGRLGIARWVMRKKHYRGALGARDGYLTLETLRASEELMQIERVVPPKNRAPDQRELKMAEQLIGMLEGPFEPEAYKDEYRERVLSLVEAKAKGRVVRLAKAAPRESEGSLLETLQASVQAGRKKASSG
jgi:DNA end-binding protein Ku